MSHQSLDVRIVDSQHKLNHCLQALTLVGVTKLAMDLEGVNLSRNGRVSLIQIMTNISSIVWIIDITTLGSFAFAYADSMGWTLKLVLENPSTTKLLFDVRNDSDSLYNCYGITLANVYDLQLLEVAVRRSNNVKAVVISGLSAVIRQYLEPDASWTQIKDLGGELFKNPESRTLVEKRPLEPLIVQYAAQDITLLFSLAERLESGIGLVGANWISRVLKASKRRVNEAMKPPQNLEELTPKKAKNLKKARIFAPSFYLRTLL